MCAHSTEALRSAPVSSSSSASRGTGASFRRVAHSQLQSRKISSPSTFTASPSEPTISTSGGSSMACGHREPLQRLHGHGEAERGEEHGVGQRAHHLRAAHAVREAPRAGAPRHTRRRQPDAQRQNVRQHVERVRHQRDGVAHVPRHDLRHEEDDGDDEHQDQAARLAAVAPHDRVRAARCSPVRLSDHELAVFHALMTSPPQWILVIVTFEHSSSGFFLLTGLVSWLVPCGVIYPPRAHISHSLWHRAS